MHLNIYRRKLLNATLYFAKNTKRVNLTKLSKLLYFLDFIHFKQLGYPSIGLEYYAFDKGPVPREFWSEIKDGNVPEDFEGKLALIPKADALPPYDKEIEVHAIEKADLSIFTPREIEILEDLTFIYKEANARDISEVTHLPKQPWDITRKTTGKNKLIDYLSSIDEKSEIGLDYAVDSLKEHFELVHNLGIEPTEQHSTDVMPYAGQILFYKDFEFEDHSKKNKFLVVLNDTDRDSLCLALKTTSQSKHYQGVDKGCNPQKKVFFVPMSWEQCFEVDTYIQLPQIIEISTDKLLAGEISGKIYVRSSLTVECLKLLKNCLKQFKDDISAHHRKLISKQQQRSNNSQVLPRKLQSQLVPQLLV